jgi:hypothetical protein
MGTFFPSGCFARGVVVVLVVLVVVVLVVHVVVFSLTALWRLRRGPAVRNLDF